MEKIAQVIQGELDVLDSQDKEELLQDDQFGYRSTHFIVKIKSNWLQAPNYRGLENLKAEIQVRTVLMHAWAEIEHKLAYKKDTHIPKQFKRKLFIFSAKLEEADAQFEELRNSINTYKQEVISKQSPEEQAELELNLDSLQAVLDLEFSDRVKSIDSTSELLDEFFKFDISLKEFIDGYDAVRSILPQVEKEIYKAYKMENKRWSQVGAARNTLDLTVDRYFSTRGVDVTAAEVIEKWRKQLKRN